MRDIAEEAGLSRRTIYLYFNGKEKLFEALIYREYMQYAQTWLEFVEADPRSGTLGGYFRATMRAVNSRPLIASLLRRDRRMIGSYLRKPDNLFAWLQSGSISVDFVQTLQAAGTVRPEIAPAVIAHILEMLGYGQLTIADYKPANQIPPYDAVMETLAGMMDRLLTPEGAANNEAGKTVVRQLVATARAQLQQAQQARYN